MPWRSIISAMLRGSAFSVLGIEMCVQPPPVGDRSPGRHRSLVYNRSGPIYHPERLLYARAYRPTLPGHLAGEQLSGGSERLFQRKYPPAQRSELLFTDPIYLQLFTSVEPLHGQISRPDCHPSTGAYATQIRAQKTDCFSTAFPLPYLYLY